MSALLEIGTTIRDNLGMFENQISVRFGEVVESSIERIMGQCHRLYEAPPLGALVRASNGVFGIVRDIATSSLDPTRRVIARGAGVTSESEIYAENPQLERLLRTEVVLTVVGHQISSGSIRQYLPPQPPRIHTFLFTSSGEQTREFFGCEVHRKASTDAVPNLDFIRLLIGTGATSDDVLASVIRQASLAFEDSRAFLIAAARAVATNLGGDTSRINAIMHRLPLVD